MVWGMLVLLLAGYYQPHSVIAWSRNHEELSEVPTDIPNESKIELINNSISSVGDGLFGSAMMSLKLSMNVITSVSPNAFCGTILSSLQLELNLMTYIPSMECVRQTITNIRQRANRLSGHLAGAICTDCPKMHTVQLQENNLTTIGSEVFCNTILKTLNVEKNSLIEMPDLSCVSDTLKELLLHKNKICSVNSSHFSHFKILKTIGFHGNCITSLADIVFLPNLWPSLEYLKFAYVGLTEANFTGTNFQILRRIDLYANQLTCFEMVRDFFLLNKL